MAMDRAWCARGGPRQQSVWARGALWILALIVVAFAAFSSPARANNYVVNSTLDDGSSGTLRWAINQANAAGSGTHAISFSLPSGATITLSSSLPPLNNGSGSIVIDGSGASGLTVSGNNTSRVFFVYAGNVTVSDLNIADGLAKGGNGGSTPSNGGGGGLGAGGALFVNQGANVTVQDVTFNHNAAVGGNGGTLSGSGVAGGSGGGGLGGNGGNGADQGGGGGGGFRTDGGNGGIFGGGGGGGLLGNGNNGSTFTGGAGSPPGGDGGDPYVAGQAGGSFGGGGGGGTQANGGAGGEFGGGGGAGPDATGGAGEGGFGGGGGGAVNGAAGAGGFGAGDGGGLPAGGGSISAGSGGSGFGGAVFVRQGGTFTIQNSSIAGSTVTAGASGGAGLATAGQAAGQDLYLMTGVNANFGGT
jgi:hypothetical protein